MRKSRLAAAFVPAALLFSQATYAQNAQQRTQANPQANQRSQQDLSESALSLKGPDGQDALQVSKNAPREVRAGEQFDYQITVRNVSNSTLQNVEVVEQVDGLEVRNARSPEQEQQQQGQNSNAQTRQQGQSNNQDQSGNQNRQQQADRQQNPQNQGQNADRRQDSETARDNPQSGQQRGDQQQGNRQQGNQQQGNQRGNQQQANQQQNDQNRVQQQGNTIRYQIGKLDAGQTRTLTVSAVANDAGQAHSCMWVDFQPTLCTSIDVVQPNFRLVGRLLFDRAIETRADIDGIYNCDALKLEMAVTSTGDAATQPAQATVQLPQGLTTEDGKNEVQIDLGRIEPNKTVRREIPLKLDPEQAGDQVELRAQATAGDLKADIQLPAVKVLDPQLQVSVDAPEQAYINKPVEMNVTVQNPGQDPVLDTVVRIQGPQGAERFTVQGEGVERSQDGTINIGRLNGGESRDFTVMMQANQPTEATLKVSAEGYCAKAEQQESQIALKGIPAVLIEVVDKVDPVPVGENTTYEIAVKNQGTERDTNIQLSATLPESMEFVRGDGETKITAEGKKLTFAPLKEIAPGGVVSWTIQAKANSADKARLKVELQSDATDEPITEEEPTTLYGDSPQAQN